MLNLLAILIVATMPVYSTNSKMVNINGARVSLNDPVIIKVQENITEELAKKFSKDIDEARNSGEPLIVIEINSYGGSVYALLNMLDAIDKIDRAKQKVATICVGKCMSCGAVLATEGDEGLRYITKNGTMMIHSVATSVAGKINDLVADVNEAERLNKLIFSRMSKNTGKPLEYFMDLVRYKNGNTDWYITPTIAVTHNLVNKIGYPDLKVKINIEMNLE